MATQTTIRDDPRSPTISRESCTRRSATHNRCSLPSEQPQYSTVYASAVAFWLDLGVALVPIQPWSKRLVAGYGPYNARITEPGAAAFWFGERHANIGIICGEGHVVLDFDTWPDYERWLAQSPPETYTEVTERGVHVHFAGMSNSYRHPDGFEVKGRGCVVMVAPSVSKARVVYRPLGQMRHIATLPAGLSLLSDPDIQTLPSPQTSCGVDLISRIKAQVSLVKLAESLTRLRGSGRWRHGKCPLEDHKKAAANHSLPFWVDTERRMWGCFACNLKGDVINLFALHAGLTVAEAIKELAREVGK